MGKRSDDWSFTMIQLVLLNSVDERNANLARLAAGGGRFGI